MSTLLNRFVNRSLAQSQYQHHQIDEIQKTPLLEIFKTLDYQAVTIVYVEPISLFHSEVATLLFISHHHYIVLHISF